MGRKAGREELETNRAGEVQSSKGETDGCRLDMKASQVCSDIPTPLLSAGVESQEVGVVWSQVGGGAVKLLL